jgi:hypothetical protein
MVACETTAPLVSVTVPVKVPASSCPFVIGQNASETAINRRRHERALMRLALFAETSGTNATSSQNVEISDFVRQAAELVFTMGLSLSVAVFWFISA